MDRGAEGDPRLAQPVPRSDVAGERGGVPLVDHLADIAERHPGIETFVHPGAVGAGDRDVIEPVMADQNSGVVTLLELARVEPGETDPHRPRTQMTPHRDEFLAEVLDPLVVHRGDLGFRDRGEAGRIPVHRGRIVGKGDVGAPESHRAGTHPKLEERKPGLPGRRERASPRQGKEEKGKGDRGQKTASTHESLLGAAHRTTARLANWISVPLLDRTSTRQR